MRERFPDGVAEHLKWYVYRLIDPRNGETFYVGKGQGNRVFDHAKNALSTSSDENATDLKSQRIKGITTLGLEVAHVIHRHNIQSSHLALQIAAALIDAYPGLTNRVTGFWSNDYGVRHVEAIIRDYTASEFVAEEPLLLISIRKSSEEEGRSLYDAVRRAWIIDVKRACKVDLVLAHHDGIVRGAFRPTRWMKATRENFSLFDKDVDGRWGFEGDPAEPDIVESYVGKRVPARYRIKGARGPIRYVEPNPAQIQEAA